MPFLDRPAVAVELPGRQSHGPNGLGQIGLADWTDAVVAAGEQARGELVLVGHSMGALTLPQAALRLGERVRHVVYVAGMAPFEGRSAADLFLPSLPLSLGPLITPPQRGTLPSRAALRWMLCHDLDHDTSDWLLEHVQPTPARPALTRVSWHGFRWPCPVSYITTLRDRAVSPKVQRRTLQNLPQAQLLLLDCGHEAMLAQPSQLAALLRTV